MNPHIAALGLAIDGERARLLRAGLACFLVKLEDLWRVLLQIRVAPWDEAHALSGLLFGPLSVARVVQGSHHVEAGIKNIFGEGFRSIQLGNGLVDEFLCQSERLTRS